jgi:hypothetical protein
MMHTMIQYIARSKKCWFLDVGLILYSSLIWEPHVKQLQLKCERSLNILLF